MADSELRCVVLLGRGRVLMCYSNSSFRLYCRVSIYSESRLLRVLHGSSVKIFNVYKE